MDLETGAGSVLTVEHCAADIESVMRGLGNSDEEIDGALDDFAAGIKGYVEVGFHHIACDVTISGTCHIWVISFFDCDGNSAPTALELSVGELGD